MGGKYKVGGPDALDTTIFVELFLPCLITENSAIKWIVSVRSIQNSSKHEHVKSMVLSSIPGLDSISLKEK